MNNLSIWINSIFVWFWDFFKVTDQIVLIPSGSLILGTYFPMDVTVMRLVLAMAFVGLTITVLKTFFSMTGTEEPTGKNDGKKKITYKAGFKKGKI